MESGVARKPIEDMEAYGKQLSARLDPTTSSLQFILERVRANPRRVVFAEGEEERVIRAALAFRNAGFGTPVLIGREERVRRTMDALGLSEAEAPESQNARPSTDNKPYADFLYGRLQRRSEEHTSELQSLMRISYAVFCLKKKQHMHTIK